MKVSFAFLGLFFLIPCLAFASAQENSSLQKKKKPTHHFKERKPNSFEIEFQLEEKLIHNFSKALDNFQNNDHQVTVEHQIILISKRFFRWDFRPEAAAFRSPLAEPYRKDKAEKSILDEYQKLCAKALSTAIRRNERTLSQAAYEWAQNGPSLFQHSTSEKKIETHRMRQTPQTRTHSNQPSTRPLRALTYLDEEDDEDEDEIKPSQEPQKTDQA